MATTTKRNVSAQQPRKVAKQRFVKQAHIQKKERLEAKLECISATAKVLHDTRIVSNAFRVWRELQAAAKAKAAQQEEALKAAQVLAAASIAHLAAAAAEAASKTSRELIPMLRGAWKVKNFQRLKANMAQLHVELQAALEARKERLPLALQMLAALDESRRPAAVVAAEDRKAELAIAAMEAAREAAMQAAVWRRARIAEQLLQRKAQLLKEERLKDLERRAVRRAEAEKNAELNRDRRARAAARWREEEQAAAEEQRRSAEEQRRSAAAAQRHVLRERVQLRFRLRGGGNDGSGHAGVSSPSDATVTDCAGGADGDGWSADDGVRSSDLGRTPCGVQLPEADGDAGPRAEDAFETATVVRSPAAAAKARARATAAAAADIGAQVPQKRSRSSTENSVEDALELASEDSEPEPLEVGARPASKAKGSRLARKNPALM